MNILTLPTDVWNNLFPTPKWILTEKAEIGLEKAGKLQDIKTVFENAVNNTNKAYASVIPNTIMNITTPVIIIGGLILLVIVFVKRG
jgi:hypothetical protein